MNKSFENVELPNIEEMTSEQKFWFASEYNDVVKLLNFFLKEKSNLFGDYEDAVDRITNTYPYDGSKREKVQWHNSSSYIDDYIFENVYPRTTGYAIFGDNWGTRVELVHGYGAPATASYEYISFAFVYAYCMAATLES